MSEEKTVNIHRYMHLEESPFLITYYVFFKLFNLKYFFEKKNLDQDNILHLVRIKTALPYIEYNEM